MKKQKIFNIYCYMPYTPKKQGDAKHEILKRGIKKIMSELLFESAIMRNKEVSDSLENQLNKNVGLPFDDKEKQLVIDKQKKEGLNATITKNNTEIKFSSSDEFGNNEVNVVKKLKNMEDSSTVVYASFFNSVPTDKKEIPPGTPLKSKEEILQYTVFIKISQPFEDTDSTKINIFGNFLNELDL